MKVLFIGDIVGKAGADAVKKGLGALTKEFSPDIVVANAENVNSGNGITKAEAEELHYAGVDVITLGNHAFRKQSVYAFLDDCEYIVRPANYPSASPGHGSAELKTPCGTVEVVVLAGQINLDPADNPFYTADKIIKNSNADFIIIDFHAEATSEKRAFGYYVDGRVSCVFGTHTHVQTADEQFLPKGTAYITDVGMTGSTDSVIGAVKEQAIAKFISKAQVSLEQASEKPAINAIFADTETKKTVRIFRNVY